MRQIIQLQLLIVLLSPAFALAKTSQPLDEIHSAVVNYLVSKTRHLSTQPEIDVHPLDRRLRLSRCTKPLKIFLLPGSRTIGRVSVGIRCEGKKPWTIYSSATIKAYENIVIASSSMVRGAEISAGDISIEKREISTLRTGYLTDLKQAIGKKLKRSLQKGSAIRHQFLKAALMVKKGSAVTIIAKNSRLTIRMKGKALSNGSKGELISVKNSQSGRIVQGKIIADNLVQISSN
jgi:flagella basal body P-ring formation protein FlgA